MLALTRNTRSFTSADLHGERERREQDLAGRLRIRRNAVRAAEIVEGSKRNHPERTAASERRLGHRIDGSVASCGHDHTPPLARALHDIVGNCFQSRRLAHFVQRKLAPRVRQRLSE